MVVVESTPRDFGRVAAQTARQVIQQRIRDAERMAQLAYYQKQLGEIVSGVVQAVNAQGLTIGMEMHAEGFMARKDTIPGERFRIHDRVRALIAEVKDNPRGPQIVLSRTHRDFLRRLLENEVPEIYHGVVEIRSIAREPGERAKVAVSATQSGIDPVGACVGIRGVRIQAIVRELHDEKIDVIEWNPDSAQFIAKAISPARVVGVYLNERSGNGKTATVVVPEDQLSLAIGRDGQNARLAAKLTGWRIDIKSLSEAASDALHRLQQDASLAAVAEAEADIITPMTEMLAKKAEGRPLTPEEYEAMGQFVDRVEKRTVSVRQAEQVEAEEPVEAVEEVAAAETDTRDILDSGLPEHVSVLLQEAGYATVGDLVEQVNKEPDAIFRIQGIGPKAMTKITEFVESLTQPVVEEAPAEEVETTEEVAVTAEAEAPAETTEAVAEAPETAEEVVEEQPVPEAAVETSVEAVETAETAEEQAVEEEEVTFDELFALKPELIEPVVFEEEEEEETTDTKTGKKGKKKKKKHVEVEYDPERDMTIARKKHKRDGGGWEWE
jgi:N utilization substance protein A